MNDSPLVSAIIIFFNAEPFIQEAIESVFAQTYGAWELILVDDGSSDGSTAIARCYAARYPDRVRYLEHDGHRNRGMSASRNLGIRSAAGEYLAFLDADDVWLPHKLERQVALLRAQPNAAMVYGATLWWYSWTGNAGDRGRDFVHDLGVPPDTLLRPPSLFTTFLGREGVSPCMCSVLIRREAVESVGGFEESFRGMYEDQAFFAKLSLRAPILVMSDCGAKYRQHSDSNCSVTHRAGQDRAARATFLNWLATYLSDKNIEHPEIWRALKRELQPRRYSILRSLAQRVRSSPVGDVYRSARRLRARWRSLPGIRHLCCLAFRRLQPIGNGRLRGTPIVRHYWARFLERHRHDVRGAALEIGTTATLRQYGGQAVTRADAIDLNAHSPEITVVGDLSRADHLPPDTYDCFINQFTLHLIYDVEAALYHSIRMLKPGGVLLANFSCVDYAFPRGLDMGTGARLFVHWCFTPIQVENLLRRAGLTEADFELEICGNLFARVAYQMNLPAEELTARELAYLDPGHPLLICVRVVKPASWHATKPDYRTAWLPEVTPALWNPVTGHYAV